MSNANKLSLVIITLNEERNIERCIKSAPFASEVIVVDSHSSDRTREIAHSLGAKVYVKDWLGYGATKAYANLLAANDWILSLDADEALSSELALEVQALLATKIDEKTGYEMPRKSFYLGRWILHGGWYPDYQLRLFNRKSANWPSDEIHERVKAPQVERLKNPLQHWVFKDISHQVKTNDRYSGLQAAQHLKQGKKFSILKLIFKPWSKFIECYFLKLGFLDGLPGFIIAVSAGYSVFIRWGKVWELEREKS